MKRIVGFILILVLLGCNGAGSFIAIKDTKKEWKRIALKEYQLYTFQLSKTTTPYDVPMYKRPFKSKNASKNKLVYEELYLLMGKKTNEVYYLTTFSNKYIFKGGMFNREYKDSIIEMNQIEYLYEGIYNDSIIQFKNPLRLFEINYKKDNDTITFTKIPNIKNIKDKPRLKLDDIFKVSLKFIKDSREFRYLTHKGNATNFSKVKTMYHDKTFIYFDIDDDDDFPYRKFKTRKSRIRYYNY